MDMHTINVHRTWWDRAIVVRALSHLGGPVDARVERALFQLLHEPTVRRRKFGGLGIALSWQHVVWSGERDAKSSVFSSKVRPRAACTVAGSLIIASEAHTRGCRVWSGCLLRGVGLERANLSKLGLQ